MTGPQLKILREQAGLSLEEIGVRTRIPLPYLQAIEEGPSPTRKLPPPAYMRGYLRKYALFLESNRIIPPETPVEDSVSEPVPEPVTQEPSERISRRPMIRGAILGASVLIVLVLISELFSKVSEEEVVVGEYPDQILEIRPTDRVRVVVRADNRLLFEGALEPSQVAGLSEDGSTLLCSGSCRFEAHDVLDVTLANVSLVSLRYNGKELKPLGAQGRSRRFQFIDDAQAGQ
jgi:transcriptional regulator with XRE-family HTH domain